MKIYPLVLLIILFQSYAYGTENRLNKAVVESVKGTGFNGTILVSKNAEIVIHQNIGFANLEKTEQISPRHLYSPGSVGKEFTTVSIMQLVQQGKLSYQDKVSGYVEILPEWAQEVTVEHILTHTSGLPKIKWQKDIDTANAVAQIKSSPFKFQPGTGYLYSNLNVMLRALVIEKITGKPYADFLQKEIFDVAGMRDSYQQISPKDVSKLKIEGDYQTYLAGVTIYVSALDLLKFEQALSKGVLVPWDQVTQKLKGNSLSEQKNRAYFDFGLFNNDDKGKLTRWEHDGSNPSHHTIKHHDFTNDVIIILMSSDGNKSTLYKLRDVISDLAAQAHQQKIAMADK